MVVQQGHCGVARLWRRRLLAVGLGLVLSPAALAGLLIAWSAPTGGTQCCDACGVAREVYLYGLIPEPLSATASTVVASCSEHAWRRSGCWRTPSGFACHR